MFQNLVLSGGGHNGISYLGCIKYLQEHREAFPQFKNIIGSSVGSIFGFYIALNIPYEKIVHHVRSMMKLIDKNTIDVDNIVNIWYSFGAFDCKDLVGNYLRKVLVELEYDENISFVDFAKVTGVNYIVVASNITKMNIEYFGIDDNKDLDVVSAICASCTIPFYFKPVIDNDSMYVDAALFCNTPSSYWLSKKNIYSNTLTIQFECANNNIPIDKPKTFIEYFNLILKNIYYKINAPVKECNNNKVIVLDAIISTYNALLYGYDETIFENQISNGYKTFKEQIS